MPEQGRIHVGTSGWHYDHWRGPFYPTSSPKNRMLEHYADRFSTVEINNTFYSLPATKTLAGWRDRTPDGFVFSVKASRYITHRKKLKDPDQSLPRFFESITALGDKTGPVLFQLPPRWRANPDRLETFMDHLPEGFRYTFEFRDPSWLDEPVFEILRRHNAALCIYDLDGFTSPRTVTADFVYIRLHGPEAAYEGHYDTQTLSGWAGAIHAWADKGREVFCYFDNDEAGNAVTDALALKGMVE